MKIKARDAKPKLYALWCTVEGHPSPFANDIEAIRWSDDGEHLWFLLGTHNFYKVRPDEEVDLIPLPRPSYISDESWAAWHEWALPARPTSEATP